METFLLVLLPPQHVESAICQMHKELFQQFGLVSAYAFPPMIPLVQLKHSLPQLSYVEIPRCFPEIFHVGDICQSRDLFWEIREIDVSINCLKDKFPNRLEQSALLFYDTQGFFLASGREQSVQCLPKNFLLQATTTSFSNFSIALLHCVYDCVEAFWLQCRWTVLWEHKPERRQ